MKFRVPALALLLSLSAAAQTTALRESSAPAFIGTSMPALYNGYLYTAQPSHVLTLFDPGGHAALTLVVPGRGKGDVRIRSVAIDKDGTLAVAWTDHLDAGIDFRDARGSLLRTIDTGRYYAMHLSFGPDHSLWSLGAQTDATKLNYPDREDYPILRKYSPDGTLSGSYLPRSLFPPGLEPGSEGWQMRGITVTPDRVGIEAYSGKVGNEREWVELDLNGNLTGRWRLHPKDDFPGVVFTDDDQAYVHRNDRQTKTDDILRLDRATSTWRPVNSPKAVLYGADGNQLIFAMWRDGLMHLSWYPQP